MRDEKNNELILKSITLGGYIRFDRFKMPA